jgi:hypothetical protein
MQLTVFGPSIHYIDPFFIGSEIYFSQNQLKRQKQSTSFHANAINYIEWNFQKNKHRNGRKTSIRCQKVCRRLGFSGFYFAFLSSGSINFSSLLLYMPWTNVAVCFLIHNTNQHHKRPECRTRSFFMMLQAIYTM